MAEAKAKSDAKTTKAAPVKGAAKGPKGQKTGRSAPTAAAAEGEAHCRSPKCKQPVRAKGYCRKHYVAWRRADTGDHHRYKICSKEACRKPRVKAGFCAEHAGIKAPEAAAPEGGAAA